MDDLALSALVVVALAVLVGAWVQAVIGIGIGLLGAPVIALVAPQLLPELLLWLALVLTGAAALGERRSVDWPAVMWALPGRVPGTAVGVWLLTLWSPDQLGIAVAVMVLLAVALSLRAVSVPVNRTTLVGAGFAAGVAGTATSIGGPPIALLFQHRPPSEARATLSVFFFLGVAVSLAGLGLAGELDAGSLLVAVGMLPFVALGLVLGIRVRDRVPRAVFRRIVLAVCAASAFLVLVRSA